MPISRLVSSSVSVSTALHHITGSPFLLSSLPLASIIPRPISYIIRVLALQPCDNSFFSRSNLSLYHIEQGRPSTLIIEPLLRHLIDLARLQLAKQRAVDVWQDP